MTTLGAMSPADRASWRREAELELDRARLAFQSARTPFARRKALRRLEAAKRAVEGAK